MASKVHDMSTTNHISLMSSMFNDMSCTFEASLLHDDIKLGTHWPHIAQYILIAPMLLMTTLRILILTFVLLTSKNSGNIVIGTNGWQKCQSNMSYDTFICLNVCYGGLPWEMICKGCMETQEKAIWKGICLDKNNTWMTKQKSKASKTKHKSNHETPPEGTIQYATGSTPCRTIRIKHLLAEATSLHVTVVTWSNEIDEQVKVFDSKKFFKGWVTKKMGEFAKAQQKPDRAPNTWEQRVGVMMTPLAWWRIPLRRNLAANLYRQALIDECNVCGINSQGTTNYTMITKALREWCW
jgi:hypothetical protein